jgi:hypothetical protein
VIRKKSTCVIEVKVLKSKTYWYTTESTEISKKVTWKTVTNGQVYNHEGLKRENTVRTVDILR